MKRVGFVYDKMLDKDFIKQTIKKASRHKSKRRSVRKVLDNIDYYVDRIYEMLKTDNIAMRPTRTRYIQDSGKKRKIIISPFFPNQIFDNLLVEMTKPIIKKSMYQYCVGNVDKRGIMYGKKVVEKNFHKYKYYMKLDIKHFYENVKPDIVIKMFERKIKDKRFLVFMRKVINDKELPIGSYYSQWFSNFYLTNFDHYIKEQLKCPFYIRYVDDMVVGSNNRKKLKAIYFYSKRYIMALKIEFKFPPTIRNHINFLGFCFSKFIIKLRHNIFYRMQRTIRNIKKTYMFLTCPKVDIIF